MSSELVEGRLMSRPIIAASRGGGNRSNSGLSAWAKIPGAWGLSPPNRIETVCMTLGKNGKISRKSMHMTMTDKSSVSFSPGSLEAL